VYKKILLLANLCLIVFLSNIALAVTWDAQGDNDYWHTAQNWSSNIPPTSAQDATIQNVQHTAVVNADTASVTCRHLLLYGNGGTFRVETGGTLNSSGRIQFGADLQDANGIVDVNGGILNLNYTNTTGTNYQFNVRNGGIVNANAIYMGTGASSQSTININGGTVNVTTIMSIGHFQNTGTHNLNMSEGQINTADLSLARSNGTACHFQFDGGTVNVTDTLVVGGGNAVISIDMTGNAKFVINGNVSDTIFGYIDAGILTSYNKVGRAGFSVTYDSASDNVTVTVPHCTMENAPFTDLNGDCKVDFIDLGILVDNWLKTGYLYVDQRLIHDQGIDLFDFATVSSSFFSEPKVYRWTGHGQTTAWDCKDNWDANSVPASDVKVIINSQYPALIDSITQTQQCHSLYLAYDTEGSGELKINSAGTLNVSQNVYFGTTTNSVNGVMDIHDGQLNAYSIKSYGTSHQINIKGGAITATGCIAMGCSASPNSVTTINIDGGSLVVNDGIYLGHVQNSGTHSINMTDGTLTSNNLYIAQADSTTSHLQFDGGTINLTDTLSIAEAPQSQGSIDIRGNAQIIISGDKTTLISNYIAQAKLTAFSGSGTIEFDYDTTNPGSTTINAAQYIPSNISAYLQIDGQPVNPDGLVNLVYNGTKITASMQAPSDANYTFGFALEADLLNTLELGMPAYNISTLGQPVTIPYPYEWNYCGLSNVLNFPRLVLPGIIYDENLYVADTHKLFSIKLEENNNKVRALFLKHATYNDGADRAVPILSMSAGQTAQIDVSIYPSVEAANEKIYGTSDQLTGTITQIPYRGYTALYFTQAQYETCAQKFESVFDWVILREIEPQSWMADTFHNKNIKTLSYRFLGALRRFSAQVTPEIEANYSMIGSEGQLYTAPSSPNGSWLLLDIRDPNARHLLVQMAADDISKGFDGVFLDGYSFWADVNGLRGGNVPDADSSLAYARWLLLEETKAAMTRINPDAKLLILGNQYYDTLGVADVCIKERMYWLWHNFVSNYYDRETSINKDLDLAIETEQALFLAKNSAYGSKGLSPVAVQSALNFVRYPSGLCYVGLGDFYNSHLDGWSDAVVDVATGSLYISDVYPSNAYVHFEEKFRMYADEQVIVTFNKPVDILKDAPGEQWEYDTLSLQMQPTVRYDIAE
jgi:hypothetical protein